MARAAVVVPNWNGAGFLGECLASLRDQTVAAQLIVVDGGSQDGSRELIARQFPEVLVVALPENRGFAAAANRGIAAALERSCDFVALFNNDAVAAPDWLEQLLRTADAHPGVGTVTGKLLAWDGVRIDSTGDFLWRWGWAYPRGRGEVDDGRYDGPALRDVFAGTGGASLYRAAMLRDVGGFSEPFFAYLEDIDLGFRARLRGWEARYEPAAVARHRMQGTSSRHGELARRLMVRNTVAVFVRCMPAPWCWRWLPRLLAALGMMAANDARRGRLGRVAGAYGDAVRALPRLLRERRVVQARTLVVSGRVIAALPPGAPPQLDLLARLRRRRSAGLEQRDEPTRVAGSESEGGGRVG